MILLIDNYDSFTWNLVQRLGEIDRTLEPGRDLIVVRNDEITPAQVDQLDGGNGPSHVIVSPGPCTPNEAGVSGDVIEQIAGRIPMLGVCLGHQCLADRNAMTVERHGILMHGKTSDIDHDGEGLFDGIDSPMTVARYHSLVVRRSTVPSDLDTEGNGWKVSAWTHDEINGQRVEVVMGLRRVWSDESRAPQLGVQFHPESFMTPMGVMMLFNFLKMGVRGRDVPMPAVEPVGG